MGEREKHRDRPRLFFRMVRILVPGEDITALDQNFHELYQAISSQRGKVAARFWIFVEILKSLPGILGAGVLWRIAMLKNTLKIAIRHVIRHRLYSFINIAGLAVGLAAAILILLYIQFEISFDRFHEHAQRIYRVEIQRDSSSRKSSLTPGPLAPAMAKDFPEVISATRLYNMSNVHISYGDKHLFEDGIFLTDPEIFDIFTLNLKQGSPTQALSEPFSVILSESMATKYFGTEDPMGKAITAWGSMDFTITGVIEDLPKNTHLSMQFIVPISTIEKIYTYFNLSSWGASSYKAYFLLREGGNIQDLKEKLPAFVRSYLGEEIPPGFKINFQPLTRIHLYSNTTGEISKTGDIRVLLISGSIALLILFLACINYMNLTTARSTQRAREIGVRKVVGARRFQLIRQFMGESMVLTLFAFILALFLAGLLLPIFNRFTGLNLQINPVQNWRFIPWIAGLVLVVGFVSGTYPAFAISSLRPATIFRNRFSGLGGFRLRSVLVVLQFCIAVVLIVGSMGMKKQLDHVRRSDVGFRKDRILVVDIRDSVLRENADLIRNDLLQSPDISSVSASVFLPHMTNAATRMEWPGKDESVEQEIYLNFVDYDYIDVFEIGLVEGRNFSRDHRTDAEGAFLLNESAVKAIGWESAVGKELTHYMGMRKGRVVGVVKDFHMLSLHDPIYPLCIDLDPDREFRQLSIQLQDGDVDRIIPFVRQILGKYNPDYPFVYGFLEEIYNADYRAELKVQSLLDICTFLAVFVACLGLLGLSAFTVERRTKEIGIRKILGASGSAIVMMVSKQITRWILISNLIAWPVSYMIIHRWLQEFAFRTNIGILLFVGSGSIALFVGGFTVMLQALKAARSNPVDVLRYE